MNHKIKSVLIVLLFVGIMVGIGIFMGFNQSIVGSTVAGSIACYDDKDCNDRITATQDICRNPGTINSLCVNKPYK